MARQSLGEVTNNFIATTAPTVNDDLDLGYDIGSRWVDVSADKAYVCLDNSDGAAVWTEITAGAAGGIANVVEDVTPQLGGDLDMNTHNIEGVSPTEMAYLIGVSSAIQTQLNAKQASDATLTSIASLGTAADKMLYSTAIDTWAETAITAAGRAILDDANAAAQRTTLGLAIGTDVQAYDATLLSIAALGTAADKMAYTTGVDTWAETAITAAGRAILDDANAAAQRTTLGLAIGTDVLAQQTIGIADNNLVEIDSASVTSGEIARFTANGLESRSNAEMKTQLGYMTDLVDDTTPQLGGELDAQANSIGFTMQTATGDGTTTVTWANGNHFDFTFGAFNETFTFTAPTKPGVYTMSLKQDSVGSRTATWPATVKWPAGTAPTLTTTATTGYDLIAFRYDGTNYYGVATLNFS